MQRRSFLRNAAIATASVSLSAFATRVAAKPRPNGVGYGPLQPTLDETTGLPLLSLPDGFRYLSFGWTGDPMNDGTPTPGLHDGMAAFHWHGHRIRLVRNHELGVASSFGSVAYDIAAGGGTTTLEFDEKKGEYIGTVPSLSGTVRNCAGGPTLDGSWLTCEETTLFNAATNMPHGYVFDVPSDGDGNPEPIRDMGRFSHEAVAVDPVTGYIYETEDADLSSGFYRFVPNKRRHLHEGGRLFMLTVAGSPLANLGASYPNNATFPVEWVEIAEPDSASPTMPGNFVWQQGRNQGAATFARLEGCWTGNDRKIYIVSTNGGIGQGQIWVYDPKEETISLLFQSPGAAILNAPDNITVSPRGGLVLCEDGSGAEFVHGLTVDGEIFPFARNTVVLDGRRNGFTGSFTGSEFAGACYSPNGEWLFVNVQSPGITFAITGPWQNGAL